jgi:hypothetical protein
MVPGPDRIIARAPPVRASGIRHRLNHGQRNGPFSRASLDRPLIYEKENFSLAQPRRGDELRTLRQHFLATNEPGQNEGLVFFTLAMVGPHPGYQKHYARVIRQQIGSTCRLNLSVDLHRAMMYERPCRERGSEQPNPLARGPWAFRIANPSTVRLSEQLKL